MNFLLPLPRVTDSRSFPSHRESTHQSLGVNGSKRLAEEIECRPLIVTYRNHRGRSSETVAGSGHIVTQRDQLLNGKRAENLTFVSISTQGRQRFYRVVFGNIVSALLIRGLIAR